MLLQLGTLKQSGNERATGASHDDFFGQAFSGSFSRPSSSLVCAFVVRLEPPAVDPLLLPIERERKRPMLSVLLMRWVFARRQDVWGRISRLMRCCFGVRPRT